MLAISSSRGWLPRALYAGGLALVLGGLPDFALSGSTDSPAIRHTWNEVQQQWEKDERARWWAQLTVVELQAFLEAQVDVNLADKRGWTPLHSAARENGNPEITELLLGQGAEIGARDRAGDTPLHWAAAENDNPEVVATLLRHGGSVNERDRYGWTPLHTAAETSSDADIIELLLNAGAEPGKRAYFLLFSPKFLLRHNGNIPDADRARALAMLEAH
ncbi:MAG: hypothetical protein HKN58_00515 [Xanthomonadales bacterium]|nr:hypothetical protein [Xanthomonadales bacterium]